MEVGDFVTRLDDDPSRVYRIDNAAASDELGNRRWYLQPIGWVQPGMKTYLVKHEYLLAMVPDQTQIRDVNGELVGTVLPFSLGLSSSGSGNGSKRSIRSMLARTHTWMNGPTFLVYLYWIFIIVFCITLFILLRFERPF